MKKAFLFTLLVLALLTSVSVAYAKGSTDKISILGTGLAHPLEITTLNILDRFDPWDGQFFDRTRGNWGRLAEEPAVAQTYNVFFYIKDNENESKMIYSFRYAFSSSDTQGYIYIPTEGENWYTINTFTIARPSGWYYANHKWDTLIRQALTNKNQISPNVSLIIGGRK